jgi:hypothetical protein
MHPELEFAYRSQQSYSKMNTTDITSFSEENLERTCH